MEEAEEEDGTEQEIAKKGKEGKEKRIFVETRWKEREGKGKTRRKEGKGGRREIGRGDREERGGKKKEEV